MLIRLLQFPLVVLMVYAVIRFTLYRIDRVQAELEHLGHPFSLWNWLNLPALRREQARRQSQTSREFLEALAARELAKDSVYAEIKAKMQADSLSFEDAARTVLLGEEPPCNTPS